MFKINELKLKRKELYEKMKVLTDENDALTEDQVTEYQSHKTEVEKFDGQIEIAEEQEKINIKLAGLPIRNEDDGEEKDQFDSYFTAFTDMLTGKGISDDFKSPDDGGLLIPEFLYADPVISTTATGIRNQLATPKFGIRDGQAKRWLAELGVTQYTGINGIFDLPTLPNYTAGFVNEAADVSTADLAPSQQTLTPRAVGSHNSFSAIFGALSNPTYQTQMIQHLVDGVWDAIAEDLFVQIKLSAPGQAGTFTAGGLRMQDLNVMDSSVIGYRQNLGYVTNRNVKAYLQQKNVGSAGIKFAWGDDDTLSGIPGKACDYLPANNVFYSANWGDAVTCLFGNGLSMIVDPSSASNSHKVKVVIRGLADTGVSNINSFTFIEDVSAGIGY